MVTMSWWQLMLVLVVAQAIWDVIKLVWVSYRRVMNRDYGGGWWPRRANKPSRWHFQK